MSKRRLRLYVLSSLTGLAGFAISAKIALASETITYSYDALGRLTASSTSGGSNNGIGTATCFDASGNRSQYQTGSSVVACTVPAAPNNPALPTPPAPPPSPPVAGVVTASGKCNSNTVVNVTISDSDPGGNTPITLIGVSYSSNVDIVSMTSSTVTLNGYYPETDTLTYTAANSKGVTSAGTINFTTTGQPSLCTN